MGIIIEDGSVPTVDEGIGYDPSFTGNVGNSEVAQDYSFSTQSLLNFFGGNTFSGQSSYGNAGVSPMLASMVTDPASPQPAGDDKNSVFNSLFKWFGDDKSGQKGAAAITIAGSFLKGLFDAPRQERATKAQEKSAEAYAMNAQTNADAQQKKFDNASAIGKTNFGAKPKNGLIFSNKLAERQQRAGYIPKGA